MNYNTGEYKNNKSVRRSKNVATHTGGGEHKTMTNSKNATQYNRALQCRGKYLSLAQEALSKDDKVMAEGYYQHADHYNRVILSIKSTTRNNTKKTVKAPTTNNTENQNNIEAAAEINS